MSAIYQRARPIRWDQVVGQEHVKDVLKTALEQGRVGHAYLFSGPRGVGKTTTARLIAMTANCTGPSPKPCGECESCLSVRSGSHPDVLEIDAASNNSVDDVRDLREKVSLAAMRGGKKIYILDEAHMMSRAAFNALLKTLEEPPGHVIFILATTEPEKIIPTILSRCQHYRFRRLTPEEIAGKLAGLAQREGMTAEPEALNLIGRLADGAMRDGESLLERMLAAGTAVTKAAVEDALGLPPGERVRGIAGALVLGDAATALQGAAALYREGFAARTVVEGLVAAFADALHAELGLEGQALEGADVPRLLRLQAALDEQESRFARSADGLSLELALTHALLAADGGGGNAAPAGAAAAPVLPADVTQRLSRLERELAELRSVGVRVAPAPTQEAPAPQPAARRPAPASQPPAQEVPASAAAPVPVQGNWADVTRQASMQLRAFLKPARMHAEPGYVSLSYDEKNAFHAKQIAAKFDEVAALVLKVFGPVTFELVAPEGGRRVRLGGGGDGPGPGGGGEGGLPRSPTPAPAPPPPAQSAAPNPRADIPAFEPSPRPRASRGPDFAPVERAAPEKPVAQAAPQARAATATLDAPPPAPLRPAPPPSPDDVAPAPLAEPAPAPWEDDHAADPPPPPEGAQGGDRVAPPGAPPELYVVEEVTQEPDWDDIGGSVGGPPPSLDDAPFADVVPARPAPTPRPAAPASAPAQAAPSRPGDIRAHPLYEEIKGRFSGRVREIGKNRRVQVQAAAGDADGTDDEGEGTEAQA